MNLKMIRRSEMNMPNKKEDSEINRKGPTFPGFNAEAVFYGTSNQYRHDGELAQQDSCITPAMICFGDDDCNRMFSGTSCPPSGGRCFILPRGGVICVC